MEEALSTQKHQWPLSWNRVNPLAGSRTFPDMTPAERLNLLRTLAIWSLTSSDVVSQTIKDSYKINRREDDINQPLSVQHWGYDGDKRKYYLIEGQDDTSFRVYREANRSSQNPQWWSVAETIDEVNALAEKLETKDTTQAARRLADKVRAAVPRFEASEEVSILRIGFFTHTDSCAETQTTRVQTNAQGAIHKARTRFLPVRRSHPRQAHSIHILRQRRRVRCHGLTPLHKTFWKQYTCRIWSGCHSQRSPSPPCQNWYIWRIAAQWPG